MNAVLTRVLCAILLATALAAQQSPAKPHSPAPAQRPELRIAGVVVNAMTGQPVPAATLAIAPVNQGTEREIAQSVTTATDGRFAFSGLTRGKYSLIASARGFSPQSFEHHGPFASAIAVGPDIDSEHLVFHIQPDAVIEGDVTDENNEPIQYASVRLYRSSNQDGRQRTHAVNGVQTDDLGHYHIGHLEPGTYYLAVTARPWYAQNAASAEIPESEEQYRTQDKLPPQTSAVDSALDVTYPVTFYPGTADSADATPLQLAPGERETADLVLRAVPALHLRIHAGGAANRPEQGGTVFPIVSQRVFGGHLEPGINSPTSWVSPGMIEISGLAPGHYIVEIPRTGKQEPGARPWYREIDLTGDMEISSSDAPTFADVKGRILFEGALRPPPDVSIQLVNPATGESSRSDINPRGEFDLSAEGVRPGRYLLGLENAQGYSLQRLAASGAKLSGRSIEIGGGGAVRISGTAIHGAGQVNGTATHDGKPFAGAMVVLVPQDAANNYPLFRRDQSDSDGTFTLPEIVPGEYTVIALANGWDLSWADPAVLQPYLKNGASVQVPASGKLDVKVEVQ